MNNLMQYIMKDKTMSIQQKLTAFMMYSDPKQLPDNPNAPDFTDLGVSIKKLIDSNKIAFGSMNKDGTLDVYNVV